MKRNFSLLALCACASAGTPLFAVDPTDVYDDPYYSGWQWQDSGGLDIADVWAQGITGQDVVIGIVDYWIDLEHEDLNISKTLSVDFNTSEPVGDALNHGTKCAGVAAAIGGNGIGLIGAAPAATIAGIRGVDRADSFYWGAGVSSDGRRTGEAQIGVKSNSYGNSFRVFSDVKTAIGRASANNVVHCFSAGNSRAEFDHQYDNPTNTGWRSYGQIKDVVLVASCTLGYTPEEASYSSFSGYGSSVFVTAPGESMSTTDRMGNLGDTPVIDVPGYESAANYTNFSGTSAATPLVSGVIALGKQVCPDMDVRWAKHALAWSSGHGNAPNIDPNGSHRESWETTPTGTWQKNNGGYWFNNNYGFGVVDPAGFVDAVRDVLYTTTEETVASTSVSKTLAESATGTTRRAEFTVAVGALAQNVETVSVNVNFSAAAQSALDLSSLKVTIVDPSDLESIVVQGSVGDPTVYASGYALSGYSFLSNAFWGSTYGNAGEWKVIVEYSAEDGVNTTDWVSVGYVEWSTGNVVFEGEGKTVSAGTSVDAHAIALDSGSFSVAGTMRLEDSVSVSAGTFVLENGGVLETLKIDELDGAKGLKYTQSGGNATLAGTADFSRGMTLAGGTLTIAGGNISAGAEGLLIDGGRLEIAAGVALSDFALEIVLGDAYLADAALFGTGTVAAGTQIVISGELAALLGDAAVSATAARSAELAALNVVAGTANELTYRIFGDGLTLAEGVDVALSSELQEALDAAGWTWDVAAGNLTLSAVPEPSAFGLLAGTLALALAVSRRSRRREPASQKGFPFP